MGGLVARQYIQSEGYDGDVDQLIFLGTPHLGSPKSYLAWEGAELGSDVSDRIGKAYLSLYASKFGYSSLFDFIRYLPIQSLEELLPTYDYIYDVTSNSIRQYPGSYPRNSFLENLNSSVDLLLNSGVRITNIVGYAGSQSTMTGFRVINSSYLPLWEDGYPENFYSIFSGDSGIVFGQGDSTVPENSGKFINNNLYTVNSIHTKLPTRGESIILKELTGRGQITLVTGKDKLDKSFLFINLLSPVDMLVVAPDGKRVGKNFETGGELEEIEGVFYSGHDTDQEFVTIPDPLDGDYMIFTQGTDNGEYGVVASYINDGETIERRFTGQTAIGLVSQLNLMVDNENPSLTKITPDDIDAPNINISSPQQANYPRSQLLQIAFDIQDSETGVYYSQALLDNNIIEDGDLIDLFYMQLGQHSLDVTGEDYIGNRSEYTIDFIIVATLESTVSDINRCYTLGWIDEDGIKDSLIAKLRTDKLQAKAFLNELNAQVDKHINLQAYNLLSEDINWLLNN